MGLWARIKLMFKSKANAGLNKFEDPRQTLDLTYEQMQQQLSQAEAGLADVATARKRLELQRDGLIAQADKLQQQAEAAVQQGNEPLAREALARRQTALASIESMAKQQQTVVEQQTHLQNQISDLRQRVQAFRTEKETMKATYTASKASVAINSTMAGIGKDLGTAGATLDRAKGQIEEMNARSLATSELIQQGAIGSGDGSDDIQRQLEAASTSSGVDDALAAIKAKYEPTPIESAPTAKRRAKKTV